MSFSKLTKSGDVMTADELKLYDRQIRQWGFKGQNKLKALKVLVIGMQGLGAEISKNLILAGVHSITLKDHTDVSVIDRCSQFLIYHTNKEPNRAKASLSAAQNLNPNVKVVADTTPIEEEDSSFFTKFDLVIATECSPNTYKKISEDCRNAKVKLFIADVFGLFGYFYLDVDFKYSLYGEVFPNDQNYVEVFNEKESGFPLSYYFASGLIKFQSKFNRKLDPVTSQEDMANLKSSFIFNKNANNLIGQLDKYFSELFCELCPAVSIVGSVVVQVALNSVMKNPEMTDLYQHYNIFFYDHVQCGGNFCLFRPQSSK